MLVNLVNTPFNQIANFLVQKWKCKYHYLYETLRLHHTNDSTETKASHKCDVRSVCVYIYIHYIKGYESLNMCIVQSSLNLVVTCKNKSMTKCFVFSINIKKIEHPKRTPSVGYKRLIEA